MLSNPTSEDLRLARIREAFVKQDVRAVLLALNEGVRHRFTCLLQATGQTMGLLALVDKAGRRTIEDFSAVRTDRGFVLRTALTPDMGGPDPGPSRWTGDLPVDWADTTRIIKKGIEPVGLIFHFDSYRQELQLPEKVLMGQAIALFPYELWAMLTGCVQRAPAALQLGSPH